jgi:hypothetical protein
MARLRRVADVELHVKMKSTLKKEVVQNKILSGSISQDHSEVADC